MNDPIEESGHEQRAEHLLAIAFGQPDGAQMYGPDLVYQGNRTTAAVAHAVLAVAVEMRTARAAARDEELTGTGQQLPPDVLARWTGCSRAEAIRQAEINHSTVQQYGDVIEQLHARVAAIREELAATNATAHAAAQELAATRAGILELAEQIATGAAGVVSIGTSAATRTNIARRLRSLAADA